MGVVKELGELHTNSGEVVDVEEAPIVDVVCRDAEVGSAPVLVADESVQPRPTLQVTVFTFKAIDRVLNGRTNVGVFLRCGRKLRLEIESSARDVGPPSGQVREGIAQTFQLWMAIS